MVKHNYVYLILGISLITFFVGLFLGSQTTLQGIDSLDLRDLTLESIALEYALVHEYDEGTCVYLNSRQNFLFEELAEIGRTLSQPGIEEELGANEFDLLKRRYHLMQMRSYIQDMRLSRDCDLERKTVLFYYQNPSSEAEYVQNSEYFDASVQQGLELDAVVESLGGWQYVTVYAIEFGYAPELSFLEEFYGIERAPALVIDFELLIDEFIEAERIIELLE